MVRVAQLCVDGRTVCRYWVDIFSGLLTKLSCVRSLAQVIWNQAVRLAICRMGLYHKVVTRDKRSTNYDVILT